MSKSGSSYTFLAVVLLCLENVVDDAASANIQTQPLSSDLALSQGQHTGLYTGPYFTGLSLSPVLNVTAALGQTVHLPCHVKQLGTNSLAWVRKRDSSILSIETDIITHDNRFRIIESENKQDWVLIIRGVSSGDAGYYECQVSTEQKMSRLVHLTVMVPVTKIEGAPDIFAKSGSSVDITCSVTDASASSLIWYKDGEVIPVEDWSDVRVKMTKNDKTVVSVLTINNLSRQRFGIYGCRPDGLSVFNVTLHIIDGKIENLIEHYIKLTFNLAKEQGLRTNSHPYLTSDVVNIFSCLSVVTLLFF